MSQRSNAALDQLRSTWLDACAAVWDARQAVQEAQHRGEETSALELNLARARGRAAALHQALRELESSANDDPGEVRATARSR